MEAPPQSVKSQTSLWSEIVEMAWTLRHTQLVKRAVVPILSNVWSKERNREFIVMQVKAQFTLAEALVEELKLTAVPPLPSVASDNESGDPPPTSKRPDPRALGIPCERDSLLAPPAAFADKVDALKNQTISAIECGIRRAVKLGPTAFYLVESGAVLLWNFHIHIFRTQAYGNVLPSLQEALATAHSALIETTSKDAPLLASISEALALSSEASGDLNAAEKWCTDCIPFGRPMQVKRLVEILARIKFSRGSKDVAPPVDTKSGQKPNLLFNVSATCVAISSAAKKGESTLAERTSLLSSAYTELSNFRDARRASADSGDSAPSTREDDEEGVEYEAELWVRLAEESLSQGLLRQAQACCSFSTEQLPPQPEMRKRVPVNTWRWFSCSENIWGRAIAAMVNEEGQDRPLQDELRRAALKHLVTAARHGGRARKPDLILNAALHLWNIALPLTSSTISRKQIFPFVKHALSELSQASVTSNPEFRANLYILLFECYADAEDWNGGLAAVNEAFLTIPPTFQRPLWQRRVVFMSKLGKGVLDGMQKMKESDPVLQARIWSVLARAASSTKQQMSAYIQAVNSLDGKFERLEYCIEMAEWMIQTGLSKKDSNDVLMAVVDSFMAVEEASFPELLGSEDNLGYNSDDEDVATNDGDENASVRSGFASRGHLGTSHTNNPLSRQSSRASMVGGDANAPGTAATSAPGSRNPSLPGTANSNMRNSISQRSVRSAKSNASATTNNDMSSKGASAPEALEVSHMDAFIKTLAMLAKSADGHRVRLEMALSAAHYAERALLLNIGAANGGAAFAEYEALDDEAKVKCGGLKEFTANHSQPYIVPYRMEDWSEFYITEEMLAHCKNVPPNQVMKVVSKQTVSKAPLTIFHLFYVSDLLCEEGMTLQALPLLVFAEFVSHLATNTRNENLIALCGAKSAVALANLGKPAAAASRMLACGPYGLDENSSKKYKEDVEQIELQKYGRVLAKGDVASNDAPNKSMVFFTDQMGTVEEARKIKVKSFEVRHLWKSIAEQMVILEQPNTAAQYVEEALRHCSAFDDMACRAKCMIVKAKVAMMNGDVNDCIESCKLARFALKNVGGGESAEWAEASMLMASALAGAPSYAKGEAKKILKGAFEVLTNRVKAVPEMMRVASGDPAFAEQNSEVDLEVTQAHTLLGKAYAEVLISEAISARASGSPWWETWVECLGIVNGCCDMLATLSNGGDNILDRDNIRPPQLLVDMLEYQSQITLRMKPSENYMDDLKEAISLLSQATSLALDCHAFSSPPEHTEQQQGLVVKPPEGMKGEDEDAEITPPPPPPPVSKVTLPTARRAANLQIQLCKLHIVCAKLNNEHVSSKEAEEAYEREVTDPVVRYLDATAPVVLKDSDTKIQSLQSALFCATSARRLAKHSPIIVSAANAVVGECLSLLSSQKGLLDAAWDTELSASASSTALTEGSLTPSPSAADLAAAGGGKKGKDKMATGKGKKNDGNDGSLTEAVKSFDIDKLDEEVEIDENGDIRSQALALLLAAGNSLTALGSFEAALNAYMCACDAAGSAVGGEGNPVAALRSLLKGQAAGSSDWLRKLRMKSTDLNSATRNRIFSRVIDRVDKDRGSLSDGVDEAAFRPLAGGNHGAGGHTFPPVKVAKTYLNENSTAWKRNMSFGASGDAFVDDLLVLMPEDVRLFVLQLSGDGTTMYCGVASKANMPAIAKVALSKRDVDVLAELTEKMKMVESSAFAKFMIRYADENGEDGDFVSKEEKKEGEGLFINDDGEDDVRDVVERMNALMSGILAKPQIANAFDEAASSESNVVIIPDARLQILPFEALDCVMKCASSSRDFSAQMFLSRLASFASTGPPAAKSFRYIADPRWEDKGSENASKPRKTCLEVVENLCNTGAPCGAFEGIQGSAKIASVGEWQNSLSGATSEEKGMGRGFFYYGPGRCLARFEAGRLSGLNIDNCQLVVLADKAENDASYRRQSKLDNQKRPEHLSMENALETAALFSLGGANSVVLNRWATSFHANAKFMQTFFAKMMAGATCAEAIEEYRKLKVDEEEEEKEEEEEEKEKEGRGLKNRVRFNTVLFGLPNVTISK